MFDAIGHPFAAAQWDDARKYYRVMIGETIQMCGPQMMRALHDIEPYPHWRENVLDARRGCYAGALADVAQRDWKEWQATATTSLDRPH